MLADIWQEKLSRFASVFCARTRCDNKMKVLPLTRSLEWEKKALTAMENLHKAPGSNFSQISVHFVVSSSLEDEVDSWAHIVLPYLAGAGGVILVTAAVSCWSLDWSESKMLFGVSGAATAAFGCIAGFGLLFHLGVGFSVPAMPVPFLILGELQLTFKICFLLPAIWLVLVCLKVLGWTTVLYYWHSGRKPVQETQFQQGCHKPTKLQQCQSPSPP